jgi:hypothetical protein
MEIYCQDANIDWEAPFDNIVVYQFIWGEPIFRKYIRLSLGGY